MKPPVERVLILLFNLPSVIAGAQALLLGIAAILPAGVIGHLGSAQFDGVMDFHPRAQNAFSRFSRMALSTGSALRSCSWPENGFPNAVSKHRFFRHPGIGAVAQHPDRHCLQHTPPIGGTWAPFGQGQTGDQIHSNPLDAVIFGTVTLGILVLVCWMVALMYKSYCVSCNLRGGKSVGTFIAGLILAEALSKVALYWLGMLAAR